MDIGTIVSSIKLTEKISEYLGIVETIEGKIDQLLSSPLKAGISALEDALRHTGNKEIYLNTAYQEFNRAKDIEKEEKQILAYLGLALCHYSWEEHSNADNALKKILDINIEDKPIKRFVEDAVLYTLTPFGMPLMFHSIKEKKSVSTAFFEKRKQKIDRLKKSIRNYL